MFANDDTRLRHMRDAAKEAIAFTADKKRSDLDLDRQLVLALTKCIEIIGEAASNISEETRKRCPAIPWPQITGVRNRLIHAYFDVDLDILWDTVVHNLGPLVADLGKVVPPEPAD